LLKVSTTLSRLPGALSIRILGGLGALGGSKGP